MAHKADQNGLVQGHAYTITGLYRVDADGGMGRTHLVRVRNPWGDRNEWTGKEKKTTSQVLIVYFALLNKVGIKRCGETTNFVVEKRWQKSLFCCSYPTTNGGMQNGSSVGILTHSMVQVFARLAPTCMLIINFVSALELSRNLIKSALSVG